MAIEDVEALAYVLDPASPYNNLGIDERLKIVEKIRYVRASLVQCYSRAVAANKRLSTEEKTTKPGDLDAMRFQHYVKLFILISFANKTTNLRDRYSITKAQ
jgi:2-polyprenyl-6-methoxyphenol hydroxylase-like FAD-dependent oxidoreductase